MGNVIEGINFGGAQKRKVAITDKNGSLSYINEKVKEDAIKDEIEKIHKEAENIEANSTEELSKKISELADREVDLRMPDVN